MAPGEVAEWSNAPHSKCGIGASLSGVRIPPSPPALQKAQQIHKVIDLQWLTPPDWYTRVVHMILMTASPWKHPDSGFYWFRRRVPDDLRALVGQREERFSLGTREPAEAKRLHALRSVEVEQRWSNLRRGPQKLSWEEAVQAARTIVDQWKQQLAADPHRAIFWDSSIGSRL